MARLIAFQCEHERMNELRDAGHDIFEGKMSDIRTAEVVLIGLDRRPANGREIAVYIRGTKSVRHLPIVFVEGLPEKVEAIRKVLPDAVYTTWKSLPAALTKVKPIVNPVIPAQMMSRYQDLTVAQKLGIKADSTLALIDPPRDYARVLGELPTGVETFEDAHAPAGVTLGFIENEATLHNLLLLGRKVAGQSKFWVCWRKGSKDGCNEHLIRESAIALGLVDYKVCALDQTWSALALAKSKG